MTLVRPLGFWETIQKTFFDSFCCSGVIMQMLRVEGPLDGSTFLQALGLLQRRHPLLRARFGQEAGRPCFLVPEADEPFAAVPVRVLPLAGEGQVHSAAEAEARIGFEGECLWRALLFEGRGESWVVFIIHHSIADGLSIVRLVDELLSLCSAIARGEMPERPGLPVLPAVESLLKREQESAGAVLASETKGQALPPDPLPYEAWLPPEQRRLCICRRRIGEQDSRRFAERCRSQGVTVTGAVIAGLMLSQAELAGTRSMTVESGISLRPFCDPEIGPEHIGCYIAMLQMRAAQKPGCDFWEHARACQAELRQAIAARRLQGFLPKAFHPAFVSAALKNNLAEAETRRRFAAGLCFSNAGVLPIQPQYGPFRLADLTSLTCETAGLWKCFCGMYCLHDRLYCNFSFAEPLTGRSAMDAFADTLIDILVRHARA